MHESFNERLTLIRRHAHSATELRQRQPAQAGFFDRRHHRIRLGLPQTLQTRDARRCAHASPRRQRIENGAAGNRGERGVRAQDEPIATNESGRRVEIDPDACRCAWLEVRGIRQHDAPDQLTRALMKPDARTVFELARGRQQLDLHVGMPRDCHCVGGSQRLTACDVGDFDAGEIHGHALSRDRLALRLAMHMKSANLDHAPRRLQHQFIVVRQPT